MTETHEVAQNTQTYLVGGAVRDRLLGRSSGDRDWVVVGSTPARMLESGYQQVGRDFPVFLHPESKEEYALARTERKSGVTHTDFICDFSPDISLEDDLLRRDLTINAIAQDSDGALVDPFGGQRDLEARILRHVSPAFTEDPLRVFRLARFAAQLGAYHFTIAEETARLVQNMCQNEALSHLSAERVWQETEKALRSDAPQVFFEVLHRLGGLKHWFPELEQLFGVPQRADYHPEIDTGIHIMLCLEQATKLSDALETRYAVLTHDLGKGITPTAELPSHRGHEKAGVPLVQKLSERLRVPNDCRDLALKTCEFHLHIHRAMELKPKTMLKVFHQCDAMRKPEQFARLLLACEADARGRTGLEKQDYPQADFCRRALEACRAVTIDDALSPTQRANLKGSQIREALDRARVSAIQAVSTKLNG